MLHQFLNQKDFPSSSLSFFGITNVKYQSQKDEGIKDVMHHLKSQWIHFLPCCDKLTFLGFWWNVKRNRKICEPRRTSSSSCSKSTSQPSKDLQMNHSSLSLSLWMYFSFFLYFLLSLSLHVFFSPSFFHSVSLSACSRSLFASYLSSFLCLFLFLSLHPLSIRLFLFVTVCPCLSWAFSPFLFLAPSLHLSVAVFFPSLPFVFLSWPFKNHWQNIQPETSTQTVTQNWQ